MTPALRQSLASLAPPIYGRGDTWQPVERTEKQPTDIEYIYDPAKKDHVPVTVETALPLAGR